MTAIKAFWQRYLNEIVGLTIMALMTIALIAGQAQAGATDMAVEDVRNVLEIRLTISS